MSSARGLFRLHLGVGALAVGTVALSATVAARAVEFAAPSFSEVVTLCRQALVPSLDLNRVALLVLAGLSALVVFRAVRSAVRQLRATRRFLRALCVVGCIETLPGTVLVDDPRPRAFCAGYLRRRIYVSTGTLALLSPAQLKAVLAHEEHHARSRDPLRMLVAQTLADAAFFVPVLRRSCERHAALAEVAADDAAVRVSGRRGPLAAALLAFDAHGGPAGVAPERVDHLTGRRSGWDVPARDVVNGVATIAALAVVAAATALTSAAGGLTVASVALSGCTIMVVSFPVFSALAAAQLLQRRRMA